MMRSDNIRWWGGRWHTLFTILVFITLVSLDNTARGIISPLYAVIARDLLVTEAALGRITAINILVVVFTSVGWGYWGDRGNRKSLLFYGTLLWSAAFYLSANAETYNQLLLWQTVAAVGLGCISSVGFSVVSDFIPAHRRGIALSFWGISQAGGAGAGAMLGGTIGATQWQLPFFIVAGAGLVFAILYLFTFEPKRGQTEPELADIFAEGGDYNYPIQWADIRQIVTRKSNAWLIFQGFITTLPGGALFWLSRLYIARVETMGYTLETATIAGNMLSLFFQSGFYFAILAGYLGDRWQQRDLAGRARLSLIGLLSAMPALMIVYLIPLPKLDLPVQGSELEIAVAAVLSIVTNPRMTLVFLIAVVAWALTSIHTPNRTALLTDVNLPEHRGTVIGLIAVGIGVGAAVGNALAGSLFGYLESYVDAPLNYALGLTLFQLFFIPAAWCSYKTMKTAPTDIRQVQQILRQRGAKKAEEVSEL